MSLGLSAICHGGSYSNACMRYSIFMQVFETLNLVFDSCSIDECAVASFLIIERLSSAARVSLLESVWQFFSINVRVKKAEWVFCSWNDSSAGKRNRLSRNFMFCPSNTERNVTTSIAFTSAQFELVENKISPPFFTAPAIISS
jgi:hypothetical protein